MFTGIAPRVNSRPRLPVLPHPSRTMLIVKKTFMYVSILFGGEDGGGFATHTLHFFKKSSLRVVRAHNVCAHNGRTPVAHRLHQRAACLSLGSPPKNQNATILCLNDQFEPKNCSFHKKRGVWGLLLASTPRIDGEMPRPIKMEWLQKWSSAASPICIKMIVSRVLKYG